jgi:spectinomycin phosphotransferase/16S rRNA (guanine(1405)-N(7))-methyltransferase
VLTPPAGLSHGDLAAVVEQAWDVAVDSLGYRPVGFGSHHWVAIDNLGHRHFVTVDELSPDSRVGDEVSVLGLRLRPALTAAVDLRAIGCSFVVAPITTKVGDPFVRFDGYAVALYPFIEGQSFSFEAPFGRSDRERVLEVVIALHRVPLTSIRPPETDRFVVPWLDQLDQLDQLDRSLLGAATSDGPHAAVASELIIDNEAGIRRLIARYRTLVEQYLGHPGPVVITHGEIHPGNVMATSEGWVIVDWDTALVAPPERDLWRLAQGDGSILREYAHATGTAPDGRLVDLYGLRWDLAEVASLAAEFRRPHEDTENSRKALEILRSVLGRLPA